MGDIKKLYEDNFQGQVYAERYRKESKLEYKWFMEDFLHHLFKDGKLRGKTLIDVGCGSSVRAPLIAGGYGCEVYCADLLKNNVDFVLNWLENGHNAFDFSAQFAHVAQLEGITDNIVYLEERVRKCVKEVLFCDVLADNPLHPRPMQQFDIVTSTLVLDCYPDQKDYLKGAKAISSLVRPGGYLVYGGAMGGSYYYVGNQKLPSANVDGATPKRVFTEAGLTVLQASEHYFTGPVPGSDGEGFCTLFATKVRQG